MKINLIIIICIFSFLRVRALTSDILLIEQYERGYEYVQELIEENALKDSLENKPYFSIFFENLWAITVKNDNNFVLYYGYRLGDEKINRVEFPKEEMMLVQLFDLDSGKLNMPIRSNMSYNRSFYWFFTLVDGNHIPIIEWNCYTDSEDEYAKEVIDVYNQYHAFLNLTVMEQSGKLSKTLNYLRM